MNPFDFAIMNYVNQFSKHSWMFDQFNVFLVRSNLLKGAVLATTIWWAWFKKEDRHPDNREHIISTLFSCFVAIALARALALTLPFRLRPLHEDSLHFLVPLGLSPDASEGWSSFPSDHAVLFFTLSTGLLFVSRKVGVLALIYATLFIAFPRVYLGLHYPTDIIAGAIIGIAIAIIGNIYLVKNKHIQSVASWSYSKPNVFYPLLFLCTYQIADMFDSSRFVLGTASKLIQIVLAYN